MGNTQCFKGISYNTQIISHKVVVTRGVQCNIPYCNRACCLAMVLSEDKNASNAKTCNVIKKEDIQSSLQNLITNTCWTESKEDKTNNLNDDDDDLNSISQTLSRSSVLRSIETKITQNAGNNLKSGKGDGEDYLSEEKTISASTTKESSSAKKSKKYRLRYTNKSNGKAGNSGDIPEKKEQSMRRTRSKSKHKKSKNNYLNEGNHSAEIDPEHVKSYSSNTYAQCENSLLKRSSRSKDSSSSKPGKVNRRIRGRSKKKKVITGKLIDLPPVPKNKAISSKKRFIDNSSPINIIQNATKDDAPQSMNSSDNIDKYSPLPTRPSLVAVFNSPPQVSKKPSTSFSLAGKYVNFGEVNYVPSYNGSYVDSSKPPIKTSPPINTTISHKPSSKEFHTPSPTVTELLADLGKAEEFYYQSIGLSKDVSSNPKDSFPDNKFLSRIDESRQSHELRDGLGSDIILTKISSDNDNLKFIEAENRDARTNEIKAVESPLSHQNDQREKLHEMDSSLDEKCVKYKFYIKDDVHLEHILADPNDRRIRAICDKYQCDLEVFSKTPRNGFLQYSILMKAPSYDVLRTCARALDSSLKWCISSQLK